jgi:hypothetical protein
MRLGERARRIISRAAILLIMAAAILVIAGWVERKPNADEEYLVYSAYLSDGLLNDAHDWSTGGPVLIVIEDPTRTTENPRFQSLYFLDGRIRLDGLRASKPVQLSSPQFIPYPDPAKVRFAQPCQSGAHLSIRVRVA